MKRKTAGDVLPKAMKENVDHSHKRTSSRNHLKSKLNASENELTAPAAVSRRVLRTRRNAARTNSNQAFSGTAADKENIASTINLPKKKEGKDKKPVLRQQNAVTTTSGKKRNAEQKSIDIFDIKLYLGTEELPNVKKAKQKKKKHALSRSLSDKHEKKVPVSRTSKSFTGKTHSREPSANESGKSIVDDTLSQNVASPRLAKSNIAGESTERTEQNHAAKAKTAKVIGNSTEEISGAVPHIVSEVNSNSPALPSLKTLLTSTPDKREFEISSEAESCGMRKSFVSDLSEMSPIKNVSHDACYRLFSDVDCAPDTALNVKEQMKKPRRDYSNIKLLRSSILKPAKSRAKKQNQPKKNAQEEKFEKWACFLNNHFDEIENSDLIIEKVPS